MSDVIGLFKIDLLQELRAKFQSAVSSNKMNSYEFAETLLDDCLEKKAIYDSERAS